MQLSLELAQLESLYATVDCFPNGAASFARFVVSPGDTLLLSCRLTLDSDTYLSSL